jgi:hypothetical protein
MTFKDIYEIKQNSGLHNALIEQLASNNKALQQMAMDKINQLNFQTADEVLLFIAMNI